MEIIIVSIILCITAKASSELENIILCTSPAYNSSAERKKRMIKRYCTRR